MSVLIKTVKSKLDLIRFIRFPENLYKGNPYYTPSLFWGEFSSLNVKSNPASEFCDYALYLAYKDGVIAGRVAAIVNRLANSQWNHKEVRFGWLDYIDDPEVSSALLNAVEEFGRARGMEYITGPLGFTDFDPEGMLVEGFDRVSTMALRFNYPYYKNHVEALGFVKDADWVEIRNFTEKVPEKMFRFSGIVTERANVRLLKVTRKTVRTAEFKQKLFNLLNLCYKDLYDFTVMPGYMMEKYVGFYLNFVNMDYVSFVENANGELIAFGISMPSLVQALQKCRGRLFPFGWWHILKALHGKGNEGIEMLLIGVHPDYRNTGVNSLIFADLYRRYVEGGIRWAETNAILETNLPNLRQWNEFSRECVKRRRAYKKRISLKDVDPA